MTSPNKPQIPQPKDPSFPKDQIDWGMPGQTPDDKIAALRAEMMGLIATHTHDGLGSTRINLNTDILGLFETVSAAPAGTPRDLYDQVKIYVNGATLRLYWYDATGHVWHYVTATA